MPSSMAASRSSRRRALHAPQAAVHDLADGGLRFGSQGIGLLKLASLKQRQQLVPGSAIASARVAEIEIAFQRDCKADRHDQNAGIDENPAVLKELDYGSVGIHRFSPEKRSFLGPDPASGGGACIKEW